MVVNSGTLTRNSAAATPAGSRPDDAVIAVCGRDQLDLLVDPAAVVVVVAHRRHEGRGGGVRRVESRAEGVNGYLKTKFLDVRSTFVLLPGRFWLGNFYA